MQMKTGVILAFAAAVTVSAYAGQDPLSAAKDLYASAAYEEALSALTRAAAADSRTPTLDRQVDEYKTFCLFALGRTAEAESLAESLIRKEPLIELDAAAASPRIEALFAKVRKRLLPTLIRNEYRYARTALDQKKLSDAQPHLLEASRMLAEAQKIGASDESLEDLRVLVDGFLELTRAKMDVRPQAEPVATTGSAAPAAPAATPAGPATPLKPDVPSPPAAARVYTIGDDGVVPPTIIRQDVPNVPPGMLPLLARRKGVFDVTVDENGVVQQVVVRESLNPVYDQIVVSASRRWRYRPASKGGVPVAYTKTIILSGQGQE
jgi:hypothetical protein